MGVLQTMIFVLLCFICYSSGHQQFKDPFCWWKPKTTPKPEPKLPEIPLLGDQKNPLNNIVKLAKLRGSYYLHDLMKESGLGVYRLKLFEERVILADPVAIKAIYNTDLTEKSIDFGLASVNNFTLRGYRPSASLNGRAKAIKKRGMWRILRRAERKYGNDGLYKILQKHWKSILPEIKNNQTNVDNLIDIVTVRTLTEFFFDKPFELEPRVFIAWFLKGLTPKNVPNPQIDNTTKELNAAMYAYIDSTPWAKEVLPNIWDFRGAETLKSEALFFAFIFAAFGLKSGLSSTIPLFLNLDSQTKGRILREVEQFHQDDGKSVSEKLKEMHVTDLFALEVFRYLDPVTQVFARAKTDFILDSLQGRYFIKTGTYLTGYPYGAQRDPYTFRFPNEFTTTGDVDHTERNFFAFGGPYRQKPRITNRKCLGQYVSLDMAKMFVALFAKCDIEPVSSLKFTESNPSRVIASDEPLKVNKFSCPK